MQVDNVDPGFRVLFVGSTEPKLALVAVEGDLELAIKKNKRERRELMEASVVH